jgi:hypothetical protein
MLTDQATALALTSRCAMTSSNLSGHLGSEYDPFLSSPLWLERSESPLSVMSALARLDIDPWAEAAALAALSKTAAITRLSALLDPLPGAPTTKPDREGLCRRVLALLPAPHAAGMPPARALSTTAKIRSLARPTQSFLLVLGWMVVAGLIGAPIIPRLFDRPAAPAATVIVHEQTGPTVHVIAASRD